MGAKQRILQWVITFLASVVIVMCLILLWNPLTALIGSMGVGITMFFYPQFWQFLFFYLGLSFIITLVIGFAIRSRFDRSSDK